MPINRYQIRNVYSLADPELYKAADKDDPEALLEGVAMAGLVGVLRQLGDLAEFAAEIFHDLHEEVMATAARGHGLLSRVQQLESEFPSIERAFLSQTHHSNFFPNSGIDWHPNRQTAHNLITTGDLPRFVMDSYEECRGPPRLFLLDKFDVGGAGACLKRYTDPSVYKVEASSYEIESAETQRDKKICKTKRKGSRWKGGETQEVSHVKLHQLFLEERVQNGAIEPARLVKLKKRPNKLPFDLEIGESYMNKLLSSPEDKLVHEVPVRLSTLILPSDTSNGSKLEIPEDSMAGPALGLAVQSSSVEKIVYGDPADEKQIAVDEEIKTDGLQNGYLSDDVASEMDNYMDALATMESQLETDAELRAKTDPSINQGTYSDANIAQLSDSQSRRNSTASDEENNSIKKGTITSLYSDTTGTSTENTSPVGIDSPPQPFACTEIPFHPRVPLKEVSVAEKIMVPNVSSAIDSALHVDSAILEEGTSKEADSNEVSSNHNEALTSPRQNGEHQIYMEVTVDCTNKHPDFLPTADGLSSMSFAEIPEDTTCRISENSLSEVNQIEHEEDNHSTRSVDSHCSSSHSAVLHVDEQPLCTSLAECDIDDLDVKPSDATFSDDVPVAEVAADNTDMYSKEKFKEISDDILHISDSAEVIVTYSSEDETESIKTEIELMAGAVSDANRSGGNDLSALKDEAEFVEREIESVKSEVKVVSVPDDLDINEGSDLSTLEDDVELEVREVDSINLEVEKRAAVLLLVDVDKNEDNGCSTHEEPDGEKKELDLNDTAPYDSSSKLLLNSIPDTCLSTCDDLNDDVDSQSLSSKLLQDQNHSFLAETDQNGLEEEVHLNGLSSPPSNIALCDPSNVQLLDIASSSFVFTEANHDLESKSPNHGDHNKFEAAKLEENVNQPNDQLHVQLLASQMLPQLDPPVFSGFGILPQLSPVKSQDIPPLPPLPPMQWRMRKPQNASLTPTDGGQHSENPFPSIFPYKADEGPQVVGPPTLDEIKNPDTENQKSINASEDLKSDKGGFSQMLLPEASLHTEDHVVPSEAKFAENLMAVETDPTTSERDVFWPSSNPCSFHSVDNEVPNTIRPIKVQRPRSPLIDAVAAHDKSKLRKVSDRATSQIPKGEESDAILEQIRAKSFNLKPAVQTRPSIQGPKTNLRVAAILEKANAIRQAFAGSDDDDDDSDSWSDS